VDPDFKVPESEIGKRKARVQAELQKANLGGLWIVQSADHFYFTGLFQRGMLFIPPEGEILRFTDASSNELPTAFAAGTSTAIASMEEIPGLISDHYGRLPPNIGFEWDVIPFGLFEVFRRLLSPVECRDGSSCLLSTRAVKSAWEITQMEETGRVFQRVFSRARSDLRTGLTEMELAAMMEASAGRGNPGASVRVRDIHTQGYPWHVLSGPHSSRLGLLDSPSSGTGTSAAFPVGAGSRKIEAREPIMVDFAYELNGYHMDVTRMFCIGEMPEKARVACEGAIEIHDAVLEKVRPGMTADAVFRYSETVSEKLGLEASYLGPPGKKVSFIGHGIGLELIEPPFIARGKQDRLKPGMTFALEPKMVFENQFAAGVESVFLVTETGCRLISHVPVKIFTACP